MEEIQKDKKVPRVQKMQIKRKGKSFALQTIVFSVLVSLCCNSKPGDKLNYVYLKLLQKIRTDAWPLVSNFKNSSNNLLIFLIFYVQRLREEGKRKIFVILSLLVCFYPALRNNRSKWMDQPAFYNCVSMKMTQKEPINIPTPVRACLEFISTMAYRRSHHNLTKNFFYGPVHGCIECWKL